MLRIAEPVGLRGNCRVDAKNIPSAYRYVDSRQHGGEG